MANLNDELAYGDRHLELSIMTRLDQTVAQLEEEGIPSNVIFDALSEYVELADEFGYLR